MLHSVYSYVWEGLRIMPTVVHTEYRSFPLRGIPNYKGPTRNSYLQVIYL
jgi:hypothetical protein